jgi:hypothetical protein
MYFYSITDVNWRNIYAQTQGDTPYTDIHSWSWKAVVFIYIFYQFSWSNNTFILNLNTSWNSFQIILYNFQCVWSGLINTANTFHDIKLTYLLIVPKIYIKLYSMKNGDTNYFKCITN